MSSISTLPPLYHARERSEPSTLSATSSSRPSHISELNERALDSLEPWDNQKGLKNYLRTAGKYRKLAETLEANGDIENAFIELTKSATLIEKMPTHQEYHSLISSTQRKNLHANTGYILQSLSKLKSLLEERYELWNVYQYISPRVPYSPDFTYERAITPRNYPTIGSLPSPPDIITSPVLSSPRGVDPTQVITILEAIFADRSRYKNFLGYQGPTAQKLIDLIHMLLDSSELKAGGSVKNKFLVALVRLSAKSGLYPKYVILKDIHVSETPVAGGHFGEIRKGNFRGQHICLKVVRVYQKSDINSLLKAFSKEAILWSHISHPNLLPFYGIYHLDDKHGRICLASPWMENGNITEYLKSNPQTLPIGLVYDIARGVEYLHDNDIVHGDLKGANILVNAFQRACLADFGLSTVLDSEAGILQWTSIQSTARQSGTVRWQAPELVDPDREDAPASKESDVYAFACVCYEVFTGRVPFYEVTRDATVTLKVIRGERPSHPNEKSIPHYTSGLNNSMWNMMQSCWKGEPTDRLDMKEVLHLINLENYVDDRNSGDWGDLSSSSFRNAVHGPSKELSWNDLEDIKSWLD